MTVWAMQLCTTAQTWQVGHLSVHELLRAARPPLDDESAFRSAVAERLLARAELVADWIHFSEDQRGTPAPYFVRGHASPEDRYEVGFFDGLRRDAVIHADATVACTEYLFRLSNWMLRRRRTTLTWRPPQ